ncbi:hypothetical protein HK098_002277 [Nowakowskiella sp. JEL0407]|nr:hypothetical protein HK098_002277 [Nowakowskiella sp. JEL0407]
MSWAVPPHNAVIINTPEEPQRHDNNMLFSTETRPQTNQKKKGVKTKIPDHRPKWSIYEKLVYNLAILVPDDPPSQLVVPAGGQLQEVKYGKLQKWRVKMNSWADLPEYLIDHKDNSLYSVFVNKRGSFLPLFDSTSIFLKRWDTLSIILLLYTACVTPFETAFLNTSGKVDTSSILFEIDRVVDVLFFCDMFVQARTPYRDKTTGKLVYEERAIFVKYLKSWALLDLVSIIPFELFSLGSEESSSVNLSELRLLRFLRLARLLKLLRVLRASKKLSKWQVYIQLRYASIQVLKFTFIMLFIIHWLACGFRLASEKNDKVYDAPGWVERYAAKYNTTDVWELYLVSIYWSASRISLSGTSVDVIAPATPREFGYGFFAFFISLLYFVYLMASITDVLSISNRTTRTHDLLVDNYLEMFDTLKLDERLKIKVHEYLTDHFAHSVSTRYTQMLKELPSQLHGFITIEMYIQFLAMIPYLAPFLEREPVMVQDLCRGIEIRSYAPNSHVFTDGYEGIYYLEHGIAAIEGRIYPSTSIFGRTVLRENIKSNECRALTTVTIQLLRKDVLLATLDRYPKVKYYAKRWTAWRLTRKYMLTYARLYYTAAKRGMQMVPQMLTRRPYLMDGEFDDIDLAVIEYIAENERTNTAHSTGVGEINDSGAETASQVGGHPKFVLYQKSIANPEEESKISHVLSSPKLIIYETKYPDSDKAGGGELTAEDVIHGCRIKPGYDSIYQHAEYELSAELHDTNLETLKSYKSAATTNTHQPVRRETSLPNEEMELDSKALDRPFQELSAQSYTAEDIIDEVKSRFCVDEPYSMEEFTASAASGLQISLEYNMERSKSLNSSFSSSSIQINNSSEFQSQDCPIFHGKGRVGAV